MTTALNKFSFLSPPKAPDELGRLGPYRILKVIGQGGMGVVFLAEDPQLERTVALKVMLPEAAKKGTAKERFLREARATAKIEHDHIVTIYQVGEDRGVPFLAMQLLKGTSLEDFLLKKQAKNPLAVEQILKLGREIAKGLSAAHEHGLIHRDIKPANIWLDASAGGRVKILDFGLARTTEVESNLTKIGSIVGTAAYMAPEQACGSKLDGRADLFSLGCILYRLCTGRVPWRGNDISETLIAVTTEEPTPIPELNPSVPPPLVKLVKSLLAKKPANRPASAKAVVEAIQGIERDLPTAQMKAQLPVATAVPPLTALASQDATGASPAQPQALSQEMVQANRPQVRPTTYRRPGRRRPWLVVGALASLAGLALIGAVVLFGSSDKEHSVAKASSPSNRSTPKQPEPPSLPGDMKFTRIPAGEFMMGCTEQEATTAGKKEMSVEWPPHPVKITRGFEMGTYPVTVGQFREFVAATSYRAHVTQDGKNWERPGFDGQQDRENCPVVLVTWNDAVAFCEWLSKKEGRKCRLPTEAEWEYCCRAGTKTAHYFDPAPPDEYTWVGPTVKMPHPVGQKKPNLLGLYDMSGHVWQWTADWYDPEYYKRSPLENPTGPSGPKPPKPDEKPPVVLRGGSFVVVPGDCRSASRKARNKDYATGHSGFRVVREE